MEYGTGSPETSCGSPAFNKEKNNSGGSEKLGIIQEHNANASEREKKAPKDILSGYIECRNRTAASILRESLIYPAAETAGYGKIRVISAMPQLRRPRQGAANSRGAARFGRRRAKTCRAATAGRIGG